MRRRKSTLVIVALLLGSELIKVEGVPCSKGLALAITASFLCIASGSGFGYLSYKQHQDNVCDGKNENKNIEVCLTGETALSVTPAKETCTITTRSDGTQRKDCKIECDNGSEPKRLVSLSEELGLRSRYPGQCNDNQKKYDRQSGVIGKKNMCASGSVSDVDFATNTFVSERDLCDRDSTTIGVLTGFAATGLTAVLSTAVGLFGSGAQAACTNPIKDCFNRVFNRCR